MKNLSTALFSLFFTLLFIVTAYAVSPDVNNDGKISSEDARIILRASVELETADGETLSGYDLDNNGRLSASDARIALRCAVELDTYTPPESDKGFSSSESSIVDISADLYTYEEMKEDLEILSALMPSRFSYSSMGVSSDGREIFCAVLGSGFGHKQIVVDAGIHGSEYLNPAAVMSTVEYYLRSYDTVIYNGKTVREILKDTDIYIFPMLNPDGIAISQFGLNGLKNKDVRDKVLSIYNAEKQAGTTSYSLSYYLEVWKANANGVDINRNFMFKKDGKPYYSGCSAPSNELYAGTAPFCEVESKAYKTLVEGLKNPVAVLSIHSQGNLIYWDCEQSTAGKTAARALANIVKNETGYYLDMSDSFAGASSDWTMIEKNIPSVTVECGKGHNPLALSKQKEIAEDIKTLFLAVAEAY